MTPKEARKLWTDALRSNEYKQGKYMLRSKNDTYCCLGVACELFRKNGGDLSCDLVTRDDTNADGVSLDNSHYLYGGKETGSSGYLPAVVQDWLGLTDRQGKVLDPQGWNRSLTMLNDSGHSFEEIAKLIENDGVEVTNDAT